MNNKIIVITTTLVTLLIGFGIGYSSHNTESEETKKIRQELKELQQDAEFPGEFEIKQSNEVNHLELPELEKDTIIYFERDKFFPLLVHFWIGSGWQVITSGGSCGLTYIYPVSITHFIKDKVSQSPQFDETYSKIRIYQDMEQIKAIVDKLQSPGMYYDPAEYESWKQERKDLIRSSDLPEDDSNILSQLSQRDNLLVLDYGYRKIAVSYITQEVYDKASGKTDIDVISYRGSSNELYDLIQNYGKKPEILWKKPFKLGLGN